MSNSLRPHGLYPTRLLSPSDFLGKNTAVGCHFLLQGNKTQTFPSRTLQASHVDYHLIYLIGGAICGRHEGPLTQMRL